MACADCGEIRYSAGTRCFECAAARVARWKAGELTNDEARQDLADAAATRSDTGIEVETLARMQREARPMKRATKPIPDQGALL